MDKINIEQYYSNKKIIDETIRQLEKDFLLAEGSLHVQDYQGNLFEQFVEAVHPIIATLIANNYQQFLNTLYTIDVSEQKLKQELAKVDPSKHTEVITRLVLQRELQKVLLRNIYSSKK